MVGYIHTIAASEAPIIAIGHRPNIYVRIEIASIGNWLVPRNGKVVTGKLRLSDMGRGSIVVWRMRGVRRDTRIIVGNH